ncbi:SRPBCC family protein [Aureivirga marina]|uniref:SRPBCC family protein n=1 Tax=Aureivirga marina TaxID=1182451 RepID=UPI0018C93D56|nr:SRPBCC domain-containing protein [Aureivirga marina]
MKHKTIHIEKTFDTSIENVWKAITDKELMKKWYFDIPDFKLEVGCKFQFEGQKDGVKYLHLCEILEMIPLKKLMYSWKYKNYKGITFLTFGLIQKNEKTILKLTHKGLETIAKENPDFAPENFIQGWNYIINESLSNFLKTEF